MNILITAIGSFSAECVISSLKELGHVIYGCDIYPAEWHYVTHLCKNVYRAPLATNESDYISFLLNLCQENSISYLIPLTDLEIDVLNKNRQPFEDSGIKLCMQTSKVLFYVRNKYRLSELFQDDSVVLVPDYINSENLTRSFVVPAIAKPINGRSSEGLSRIYTIHELETFIGKSNYILQRMIEGPVFTVDYVRDRFGNDFSVPREELLRTKNGAGTTVKITPHPELQKIVSYIGTKLGVIGCVNMEFIYNSGNFYLIDINPRFSAGVAFSNFIGYDMVISFMNAFENATILPPVQFTSSILCKHYSESLLKKL